MAAEFTATKGRARAPAVIVDRARHELLAGAAFPVDQDRGIALRHAADRLVDLLHGGRIADEPALVLFPHLGAERGHFLRKPPDLDGLLQEDVHLVEVKGLGDIIEGAAPHGLDRVLHRGLGGHDDDRGPVPVGLDLVERF